jgi:putative long chain acyl-CoA synthase
VLEFYASTEAGAILVNLRGAKPGSLGRPLPGSAPVKVAAYDVESRQLLLGADGFVEECEREEVGLLLARTDPGAPTGVAPLRGVFARDDAWLSTGDLFRIDGDGDYWRLDAVEDAITTPEGIVLTGPIRDALEDLPAVDLAVAYGVRTGADRHVAVAAVTLRAGRELTGRELTETLMGLDPAERPSIVHVVGEIPVTTWYRPLAGPLRAAGVSHPSAHGAWYRNPAEDAYLVLTDAAAAELSSGSSSPGGCGSE